jgi:DNA-directed RNA polymerase specialized sigma subunit
LNCSLRKNFKIKAGDTLEKDKDQDLYKKTDGVLFNYKTIKAEINNIEIEIEELREEFSGVSGVGYQERSSPTNEFNSSVENEILKKEKEINKLLREKRNKERLISKIDNAIETLEYEEKEIIKLRCFEKRSWNTVGSLTNRDGDHCSKIKRDAIKKISELIWIRRKYTDK